jgi:hypothetical protein
MTTQTTALPIFAPTVSPAELIRLEPWQQRRLPQRVVRIRVIQGAAWVTSDCKDVIVRQGETLTLPRQPFPVVISGLGVAPVIFEETYRK